MNHIIILKYTPTKPLKHTQDQHLKRVQSKDPHHIPGISEIVNFINYLRRNDTTAMAIGDS